MGPSRFRTAFEIDDRKLFLIEQWIALWIGIVCLGASFLTGMHGYRAFPVGGHPRLGGVVLNALNWVLTIAVALIGVVLVRFAFYKRREREADREPASADIRTGKRDATEGTNGLKLVTGNKGRG